MFCNFLVPPLFKFLFSLSDLADCSIFVYVNVTYFPISIMADSVIMHCVFYNYYYFQASRRLTNPLEIIWKSFSLVFVAVSIHILCPNL